MMYTPSPIAVCLVHETTTDRTILQQLLTALEQRGTVRLVPFPPTDAAIIIVVLSIDAHASQTMLPHIPTACPILFITSHPDQILPATLLIDRSTDTLSLTDLLHESAAQTLLLRVLQALITQHRMAQTLHEYAQRSQQSEARLRTLIEHIDDAVIVIDNTGHVRFVNPAAEALLGRSAPQLIGQDFGFPVVEGKTTEIDILSSHYLPSVAEMRVVETIWEGNIAYLATLRDITARKWDEEQLRHLDTDLEQRVIERTAHLVVTNQELQHEITERRLSESVLQELTAQLSHNRNLLRTIFDGLEDGLTLLSGNGIVLAINHALAAMLDSSVAMLVDQPWELLCNRSHPPFPGAWVLDSLHDGRAHRRRKHYRPHNLPPRILDMQTFPLMNMSNSIDQMVVHIVDVTERIQLEELAIRNERFLASDKLATAMAHEINTPLQSIQNCLYLSEKTSEERRSAYLALAREELERVSRIVQQLLDLHHPTISSGTTITINGLIHQMLLLTGSTLARQGIAVECTLEQNLPPVWGQRDQIKQVLLNIILNAIDAMPNGGTLCITTTTSSKTIPLPPSLIIHISDTGIGIGPEHQRRIFEPFFTTRPTGSGLGLAISQKIIRQHGGTITVKSQVGTGTTITITLPLTV